MTGGTVSLAVGDHAGEPSTVLLVHILDQEGSITQRSRSGPPDNLVVCPPLHLLHWIPRYRTQEEDILPGHSCNIDLTSADRLA